MKVVKVQQTVQLQKLVDERTCFNGVVGFDQVKVTIEGPKIDIRSGERLGTVW